MDYFIRIVDGQPVEHPIAGDNFRAAFPNIDVNNLPPEFARFIRLRPTGVNVGFYENLTEAYVWANGVVRDNWHAAPMSAEEYATKKQWGIEQVEAQRQSFLQAARAQRAIASQAMRPVWDAYIATLTAYTYEDPAQAALPMPPTQDVSASGSAPNVIG